MAGANTLTFSDATFDEDVLRSELPVLVDFWAEWCGPCKMIAPLLAELAAEYQGRLAVGKLNVDENRQSAARFGIRSIPTLLFLRDGVRVDEIVGAHPKSAIKAKVDQLLST
jgi:thioredoxin 1